MIMYLVTYMKRRQLNNIGTRMNISSYSRGRFFLIISIQLELLIKQTNKEHCEFAGKDVFQMSKSLMHFFKKTCQIVFSLYFVVLSRSIFKVKLK